MDQAIAAMKRITKSPYTNWILKEVKPKDFNPLMLDKFKGESDPMDHLLHYREMMSLEVVIETLTGKVFATTLTRKALSWFSQLPEGSVRSFEQLEMTFLEQYRNYCP